jgi:pyruvate/2-oxoglutarate/acetoin dehydrogenase E1 component
LAASTADVINAILAAYEDNNPVLLFEHKGLYRRGKHAVSWDANYRDVWQPQEIQHGLILDRLMSLIEARFKAIS